MTVHYGVIGCGMMGQEHLRNIALLAGGESGSGGGGGAGVGSGAAAAVSVIFEPDAVMAAQALQLAPGAVLADTIEALLAHEHLDCILISSPNHCHVDQLEAIAARVRLPVLVEKPLFTDPADLPRLRAFERAYTAPVWVAMEYRYMPPMQQFLARVDAATGGARMLTIIEHRYPFLAKVNNWNRFNARTGGTFVEKCCHFFDLMRLIVDAAPTRLMASVGQMVNHLDERYDGAVPDIADCGYVIVDFANGTRAALELSMFAEGSEYQEMIHAIGPTGKLEVKLPGPSRLWTGPEAHRPVARLIESPRSPCNPISLDCPIDAALLAAGDHNGATFHQHQKFLELVRSGRGGSGSGSRSAVEVTLNDGIEAVRMGHAAAESARLGIMVTL